MQDNNYHQQQLMEIPSTFEKRKKQQKKQQLARSTFSLFLFVRFFFLNAAALIGCVRLFLCRR
jgi:hypothetical protein